MLIFILHASFFYWFLPHFGQKLSSPSPLLIFQTSLRFSRGRNHSVTNWFRIVPFEVPSSHDTRPLTLCCPTKVTYHPGLQRNTGETESGAGFPGVITLWVGIAFHLILSIPEIFLLPPQKSSRLSRWQVGLFLMSLSACTTTDADRSGGWVTGLTDKTAN